MIRDMSSHGVTLFGRSAKEVVGGPRRGDGSLAELAARFGVSRGWAWKISSARRRSGAVARPSYRPSPRSRLDRQLLGRLLAEHPDWTLRQLRSALAEQGGILFSTSCLWLQLKQMRFRLKKSRSTPPNATLKRTANIVPSSSRRSTRSRRSG